MLTDSQRAALAVRLRRSRTEAGSPEPADLKPRDPQRRELPLSFGQEQLWFLDRFAPDQAMYNIPIAISLDGELDQAALQSALDALAERHETLRTRLVASNGQPVQLVDPPRPIPVAIIDLTAKPTDEPNDDLTDEPTDEPSADLTAEPTDDEAAGPIAEPNDDRLREVIDTEAQRPFDLAAGPLMRASLIKLGSGRHILLQIFHHAIFDGWSANVLLRELAALYRQCSSGEPSGLDQLPVQFADYALWERARLADDGPDDARLADDKPAGSHLANGSDDARPAAEPNGTRPERAEPNGARPDGPQTRPRQPHPARSDASARYWREVMDGFETVRFPADRPRPLVEDWAGDLAVRMTGLDLLSDLRELSRRQDATLFVTLMSGLQALLHRYTGQTDLVVGTVSANRARPELASLIGFLVNTLPIRTDSGGDPTFAELMARVKEATTGAYAHQDLPFGKMVETLSVARDPGRAPVFQIALAYAERDLAPIKAAGVQFTLTDLVAGIKSAKFDLSFLAEARPGGLWFECSYKTSLFDAGRITRLLGHLEVLLRGAVANPQARLSELPLLTEVELRQELIDWNDTFRPYPTGCVHELFEAQVRRTPDAVAAEFGSEQLSYAELDARANAIAWRLRELGVGPESLVGVCMVTGLTRLAVFFGIWKAGGGYVPLDPALPPDRLRYIIADTGMGVVVADSAGAEALPDSAASVVRDDTLPSGQDGAAGPPAAVGVTPANVAYVIYTSGSTGQPKGVVVEHRHAVNFIFSAIEPWRLGPADVMLQYSAFTFDVSIMDTYVPLACGARVVLADAETLHTPRRLIALIRNRAVTCVVTTPSVAGLLGEGPFSHLRMLVCGGEDLPVELALRWRGRPGLAFVNGYGPTEVTVIATYAELLAESPLPPSIGFPAANYTAYVLDDHLNPVPVGVTGELHLGGASVARGYLNRPELTTSRFIDDPFAAGRARRSGPGPGDPRLYKTGDLCYRRPDGSIVFVGRVDHQVKLRGLRIELGEIETTLAAHPQIDKAVVLVTTGPAGDQDLTAYLCPAAGQTPDLPELRARLAAKLPAYMIPASFITLDRFPLNPSGKIDRRALPAPARPETAEAVDPTSSAEFTGSVESTRTAGSSCAAASNRLAAEQAGGAAPATATEAILTRIFGAVLNRRPVSPVANFFDSGGNSLQVMRLIDQIADETQADLTPAAVFLNPTPRALAAEIDAATGPDNPVTVPNPAVPAGLTLLSAISAPELTPRIQADATTTASAAAGITAAAASTSTAASTAVDHPPLILIHAIGGTIFDYTKLAADLADTYTVYGLEAPGLTSPDATPASLSDLVDRYLDLIRAGFPDGPYWLGGWSMGGVIAYEITRRLEKDGAQVRLLALLDAPFAIPADRALDEDALAAQFLADATLSLGSDSQSRPDPSTTPAADQLSWLATHLLQSAGPKAGRPTEPGQLANLTAQLRRRFDVFSAHWQMTRGYQPEPSAPVQASTLIVSANDSPNAPTRDLWPSVLGGQVTLPVDGDHYTFLRPPAVTQLAVAIKQARDPT